MVPCSGTLWEAEIRAQRGSGSKAVAFWPGGKRGYKPGPSGNWKGSHHESGVEGRERPFYPWPRLLSKPLPCSPPPPFPPTHSAAGLAIKGGCLTHRLDLETLAAEGGLGEALGDRTETSRDSMLLMPRGTTPLFVGLPSLPQASSFHFQEPFSSCLPWSPRGLAHSRRSPCPAFVQPNTGVNESVMNE